MWFGINNAVYKIWLINSEVRHEVPHPCKPETEFKFPTLSSAHLLPAQKMQKTYDIKISYSVKMSPITLIDRNISAGVVYLFLVMGNGNTEEAYY
jgi:hypothetical protein